MEATGDLLDGATALVAVGSCCWLVRGLAHRHRFERARTAALKNAQQYVTPLSQTVTTVGGLSLRGCERRSMAVFICTWLEARVHKDCSNVGCRQDSQRLLRKCNPLRTLQDARALRQLLFVQLRAAAPG